MNLLIQDSTLNLSESRQPDHLEMKKMHEIRESSEKEEVVRLYNIRKILDYLYSIK